MPKISARRGRLVATSLAAAFSIGVLTSLAPTASAEPDRTSAEVSYLVLYNKSGSDAAAERAITKAGGRIVKVNA